MDKQLAEIEFFTQENFKKINGDDYIPDDNRTYKISPLAASPYRDIAIHMAVPKAGKSGNSLVSTNRGSFFKSVYDDVYDKAANKVLHFPKASEVRTAKGVVAIDKLKLKSLLPPWILTRYQIVNKKIDMAHSQVVPIFLDKKTKEFLFFFDEAFLDDLDPSLLMRDTPTSSCSVYSGVNGKKYLAIKTHNFTDFKSIGKTGLVNDVQVAFETIWQNYFELTLDVAEMEKVIVIEYTCDDKTRGKNSRLSDSQFSFDSAMKLSFSKAARHDSTYYLIDDSDNLITKQAFHYNREHASPAFPYSAECDELPKETTVVIPYSEEEWGRLQAIRNQLLDAQRAIWGLLTGCHGESGSQIDKGLCDGYKAAIEAGKFNLGLDKK